MDIVRANGIIQGIPLFINFWPDKEVHHFITVKKEVESLLTSDPQYAQAVQDLIGFVCREDAKALEYHDQLERVVKDRIGTADEPKSWPPIPTEADTLWDGEAYLTYQAKHYIYKGHEVQGEWNLGKRKELGLYLLLTEQRQAQRIDRIGREVLLRKDKFYRILTRVLYQAGELPPSVNQLNDAWSEHEAKGSYSFLPADGEEVHFIRLAPEGASN